MKRAMLIIFLVFAAGCLVTEEEISEPIETIDDESQNNELAILILPTSVEPNQEFEVTWEVNLEEDYDTGIVYDVDTQASDYYAYEFTTDIFSSNKSNSFSISITAFEQGQVFMRPYATSNGKLYYGEEVSVPIVMSTN